MDRDEESKGEDARERERREEERMRRGEERSISYSWLFFAK